MRIYKNIFRNLRTRFDLDVTPPIDLNPSVQLVSQIDPLLSIHEIITDEADDTALTSYVDVPVDEKWTLMWSSMYRAQQGLQYAVMYIDDTTGPFLQLITGAVGTDRSEPCGLDMMPGWGLQFVSLAGTSGAIRHTIYVTKQKWTPYVEK